MERYDGERPRFRIGVGSGFSGDRWDPAVALAQRGDLDALVFECLAERTIALAHARMAHGGHGFDPFIVDRVRQTAPALTPRRAPIITNAGAADPAGAARAIRGALSVLQPGHGRVAAVTGDDVLTMLDLQAARIWGSDEVLGDYRDRIISANAYTGTHGLRLALAEEPTVVVAGRVSDSALFLAPLMHHFGWGPDSFDDLAAGTLVGHLLECAGQLSGGYFADGERKTVRDLARLGFPMADVSPEGSSVISKLAGTGGRIDRATVTEQLLYEVDDPASYLTPDVTLDLSQVEIDDSGGDDTVQVRGAIGHAPPTELKVTVGVRDGFSCRAEISYAGEGCVRRGKMAADIVRQRLTEVHGLGSVPLEVHLIGLNACRVFHEPDGHGPPEVRVAMSLRALDKQPATLLAREVEALYTNGPAGGGGVSTRVTETVGIVSTGIPAEAVTPQVEILP